MRKALYQVLCVALIALMALNCVSGCSHTFSKSGDLSKHQKACSHVRAQREKAAELRRERLQDSIGKVTSLPNRKQRIQAAQTQAANAPFHEPVPIGSQSTKDHKEEMEDQSAYGPPDIEMAPPSPSPPLPSPAQHTHPNPPPPLTRSGRPQRTYRLPKRFIQALLTPPDPLPLPPLPPLTTLRRVVLIVRDRLVTAANQFGIWRDYPRRPTRNPDSSLALEDLADHPLRLDANTVPVAEIGPLAEDDETRPPWWPCPNINVFRFLQWANNPETSKSTAQAQLLVDSVINQPEFKAEDFLNFNVARENQKLDEELASSSLFTQFEKSTVTIDVPSGNANIPPRPFTVPDLLHCKLSSVIQDAFKSPLAHLYHFSPFKLYHTSPLTGKQEQIFGEVYNSEAFLQESEHVQRHAELPPDDPKCQRERVVAAVMLSSDATHLTSFGDAKAWPVYLMLGNLSKYIRAKPNSGAMHHVAYIPSLPDSFQDFGESFHTKWRTQKKKILTHCKRELMQAVLRKLLDDDFVHAYRYGIVVKCLDGIERRIYPRLFTYSADYPEKVLLGSIRDKGIAPCLRCYVPKTLLDRLGMKWDSALRQKCRLYAMNVVIAARTQIYQFGQALGGAVVERLLKSFSGVPTVNAFAARLSRPGRPFEPSNMLVVDLLHEFELGVWKQLFTHLICILYAAGGGSDKYVAELDRRYHEISTFGVDVIRNFGTNSSEMKKLAARDYEDLLQCAIPVFEGLLEGEHDRRVMKLLYRTAEWHALAKMRMHTEGSLELLEELTTEFGQLMRNFRDTTCNAFKTYELPKEVETRNRHQLRLDQQTAEAARTTTPADLNLGQPVGTSAGQMEEPMLPTNVDSSVPQQQTPESQPVPNPRASTTRSRREKIFNLFTVKFHFLGDYVDHIRRFGTTDSYSTQLGELAHRLVKQFYGLTNKKDATAQISKKYGRYVALQRDREQEEVKEASEQGKADDPYFISRGRKMPVDIFSFMRKLPADPAKKKFFSKLQDHLLGHLLNQEFDGDTDEGFTDEDRNSVQIVNNRLYRHATFRINYTTYDMRRSYDTVNPRNHSFVMVASPETEPGAHPFWYASVIGIFHAEVQHVGAESRNMRPKNMDFLWVRWLGVEPGYRSGRRYACMPKLGWVPDTDDYAFGFLDPALVLRGCHLIPTFAEGKTSTLLQTQEMTEAWALGQIEDWANYYVGIFVDCDMYVRHLGIGIGHGVRPENQHCELLMGQSAEYFPYSEEDGGQEEQGLQEEDEEDSEDEPDSDDNDLSDADVGYDDL